METSKIIFLKYKRWHRKTKWNGWYLIQYAYFIFFSLKFHRLHFLPTRSPKGRFRWLNTVHSPAKWPWPDFNSIRTNTTFIFPSSFIEKQSTPFSCFCFLFHKERQLYFCVYVKNFLPITVCISKVFIFLYIYLHV